MKNGRIKVSAVERGEPKVGRYVLALIELARQLQAEEEAGHARGDDIASTTEGAA